MEICFEEDEKLTNWLDWSVLSIRGVLRIFLQIS